MCIANNILQRVQASPEGEVFFVSDFAKSGNDVFISRLLSEMTDYGKLERLSNGIYYKPRHTRFGTLKPSIEQVVKAIARRDKAQIMPTGATAENMLGFSTQVPTNDIYLTTGSARTITLGNRTIRFRRCTPKNFAYRGKLMPILVQAMKSIGQGNITDAHVWRIRELLREHFETETFETDLRLAPIWIKKILSKINNELKNE